ncbi:hypothetical protein [Fodinicola feengrottensis]|uniref:hypothetical protein n=1 Tax=Fodinicola feengrottensis TaxID=435914 RepID=UPI0024430681|nr:hypothetical protein [Fodinicola feengrottensis]
MAIEFRLSTSRRPGGGLTSPKDARRTRPCRPRLALGASGRCARRAAKSAAVGVPAGPALGCCA